MSRQRQKVPLIKRAQGKFVSGWAYKGLSSHNLKELQRMQAAAQKRPSHEWDEDAHWDWTYKTQLCLATTQEVWVIERSHWFSSLPRTQGVAIFGPDQSPLPGGAPLVEVEYLSTAPHNRPRKEHGKTVDGVYRGVRSGLLQIASEASRKLGYQGLVGLYALPKAHDFYLNVGLTRHASITKAHGRLVYFEGTL